MDPITPSLSPLQTAIKAAGSVTELAARLGVRQSAVSNWLARGTVPPERCGAIEAATDGAVRAEHLRPDVEFQRDSDGVVTAYVVPVLAKAG